MNQQQQDDVLFLVKIKVPRRQYEHMQSNDQYTYNRQSKALMSLVCRRERFLRMNCFLRILILFSLLVSIYTAQKQHSYFTNSFTIGTNGFNTKPRTINSPLCVKTNNLPETSMTRNDGEESVNPFIIRTEARLRRWCTSTFIFTSLVFGSSFDNKVCAETLAIASSMSGNVVETTISAPSLSSPIPNGSIKFTSEHGRGSKYWTIQNDGTPDERYQANKALLDHIVGTVTTMYYDRSGGSQFSPAEYITMFRSWLRTDPMSQQLLSTREGTVSILKSKIINQKSLPDPFAKYLTREDLMAELKSNNDGFLGIGAIVEAPGSNPFLEDCTQNPSSKLIATKSNIGSSEVAKQKQWKVTESLSFIRYSSVKNNHHHNKNNNQQNTYVVDSSMVCNLPVITAVVPYSPAERAGLTVGDRIIAVQDDSFLHLSRQQVTMKLQERYSADINQYFGNSEITIAKAIIPSVVSSTLSEDKYKELSTSSNQRIQSYRPIRVRLSTSATSSTNPSLSTTAFQYGDQEVTSSTKTNYVSKVADHNDPTFSSLQQGKQVISGGNNIVRWQLLNSAASIFIDTGASSSLFVDDGGRDFQQQTNDIQQFISSYDGDRITDINSISPKNDFGTSDTTNGGVGYIRLTRFSRTATEGFVQAVDQLEALGATSYIIDLRNNYGGVIQSAMLLASSLLRDSHDVICFTMNSRGGFTPHDVEEFVVDKHYPGYLLSSEGDDATIQQVRKENPIYLEGDGTGWSPPSAYASLHEQGTKRGINKGRHQIMYTGINIDDLSPSQKIRELQKQAQKPLVLLVNEGTASSAEVFASALHDNGRVAALIGSKTYGKGLIQHTFPLPDGGGLRLTVAEYLTPALQHVSRVGWAQYDPITGKWVGGGLRPDVYCDENQGIPNNVGADLCVGIALDALEEYMQQGYVDLNGNDIEETGRNKDDQLKESSSEIIATKED
jgi:C-terminal processing protease CtpA/Prc